VVTQPHEPPTTRPSSADWADRPLPFNRDADHSPTRFATGGRIDGGVPAGAGVSASVTRIGPRSAPHEQLYAYRAWIAIVRDVLIILVLLTAVLLGGRMFAAVDGGNVLPTNGPDSPCLGTEIPKRDPSGEIFCY